MLKLVSAISDIKKSIVVFLSIIILFLPSSINSSYSITQFYFSIPHVISDLTGITFSVETQDDNYPNIFSWTHNGSYFIPDNITNAVKSTGSNLDLDNNDFLVASNDTIPIGTRLYICIEIPYPNYQYECQWDAVDNSHTGFAEFDFFFQSHPDIKKY